MLDKILTIATGRSKDNPPTRDELHLAAAVLLVEAAYMDGHFGGDEEVAIERILRERFGLSVDDAAGMIEAAEKEVRTSAEIWRFARTVKDQLSEEERVEIIEMLWEVAYADGVLHPYEANLLRRVSGLIYVPDRASGEARKRVMAKLGVVE